jgi:hypothetical protein
MKPRSPSQMDIQRMQRALALVAAYDLGVREGDFDEYLKLAKEVGESRGMIHALSQLCWLMLQSFEENGVSKYGVMSWYGLKFAESMEK